MPLVPTTISDEVESPERGAWNKVRAGWQQLYGSFDDLGVSVEMHDFRTSERSIGRAVFIREAWKFA